MSTLTYLSLFSGIEAASVAWHPLGWTCAAVAEIEPFPSALLAHYYPGVPNLGDVTASDFVGRARDLGPVDVVVGGSPCQAFSVAGMRRSLDDDRGNLTLHYVEIVNAIDPAFVVWENVPGVLSTTDNAFGCFLGGLVGADAVLVPGRGQRWTHAGMAVGPRRTAAWRVLDAQYFGLAQRRKRVFVVACPRDGANPAAVLFEPAGLRRHPPTRREAREDIAPTIAARTGGVGGLGTDFDCDGGLIAHSLRANGFDASEDGTGRGTPLVTCALRSDACRDGSAKTPSPDAAGRVRLRDPGFTVEVDLSPTLDTVRPHIVGFAERGSNVSIDGEVAATLKAASNNTGGRQCIAFHARQDPTDSGDVTHPLDTDGHSVAVTFDTTQITHPENRCNPQPGDPCHPLAAGAHPPAVALAFEPGSIARNAGPRGLQPTVSTLRSEMGDNQPAILSSMLVRRLTPRECERLQGFPDDYTLVPYRGKPAADGPRYRALGNSMAVPVMRWIGERIAAALATLREAA